MTRTYPPAAPSAGRWPRSPVEPPGSELGPLSHRNPPGNEVPQEIEWPRRRTGELEDEPPGARRGQKRRPSTRPFVPVRRPVPGPTGSPPSAEPCLASMISHPASKLNTRCPAPDRADSRTHRPAAAVARRPCRHSRLGVASPDTASRIPSSVSEPPSGTPAEVSFRSGRIRVRPRPHAAFRSLRRARTPACSRRAPP